MRSIIVRAPFVLDIAQILPLGVFLRGQFESPPAAYRAIDFHLGHGVPLSQRMRENRGDPALEEIQNPEIHVALCRAKLVDPVPKVIRLGASKMVPQFCKPPDPNNTLGVSSLVFSL